MLNRRVKINHNSLTFLDLLGPIVGYLMATIVTISQDSNLTFATFFSMRLKVSNFLIFLCFLFGWHIILRVLGLYRATRFTSYKKQLLDILIAAFLATSLFYVIADIANIEIENAFFFLVFWAGTAVTMILRKFIVSYIVEKLQRATANPKIVVIVGTNKRALNIARKIESLPKLGYRVLGFIDNSWRGNELISNSSRKVISTIDEFPEFLRHNTVDEVIIGLPLGSFYHEIAQIVTCCEEQGVTVRVYPDFFDLKIASPRIDFFDEDAFITLGSTLVSERRILKRAFDIVLSALLLIILSPVLLITAVLIKITSPGPVFFIQERVGQQKRLFKIYKFRTMSTDAESRQAELEKLNEAAGPVFKIKSDPRITPIGKFLRKTSIDELPQLINVLIGDMSLVGPRPLPVRDYRGFDVDWHRRRFSVRPGITCLWQVSGRSNITFDKWMELDMNYIDKWSLLLDFKILLATIPAVLKGSGAS